MNSVKPYLLKALHQWISDNGLTPQIIVEERGDELRVPPGIGNDGKIILNISHDATANLQMDDDYITFNARFSGQSRALLIPVGLVMAIYARENGKGMMFEVEEGDDGDDDGDNGPDPKPKKPNLKLVE